MLKPYVGTLHRGHHLATSRKATGWHAVAPSMALGLLPLDEAVDLLSRLAFPGRAPTRAEWDAATELARVLGCLPLALEQAGAYVYETGAGLEEYRRSLGLVLDEVSEGIDPERTIARIWDQTLGAISGRDPLAVRLLEAMAWMAPDDIPRAFLEPLAPDSVALNRALGVLHSYNMVSFGDPGCVSVHRLVQTVVRSRTNGRLDAELVLQLALPSDDDVTAADKWLRFLPHIDALADTAAAGSVPTAEMSWAYYSAAQYLFRQQRDGLTLKLRLQVLIHSEQTHDDNDPAVLAHRNNLGLAYIAANAPDKAIPLLQSLVQQEAALGAATPDTLTTLNNLALAYIAADAADKAAPLLTTTLAQLEEVLGHLHPNTITCRNNLARARYEVMGRDQAIPLWETTLRQREQVLGDEHPDTLASRHTLAVAYLENGEVSRAIPLLETTLPQRERILGPTHPNTQATRNLLAAVRRETSN